ncbi:MAG: hypothetical protein AB9882_00950 [Ignavibacteriaceae bacterium]
MDELIVLKDISSRLITAGIPFMLSGSLAMSFYAQPRMTRDVDIVIELNQEDIHTFVRLFENDYYVSVEMIQDAVERNSMFNIIHNKAIVKVDFIVRKNSEYRKHEFQRRKEIQISDFTTYIVSIEDLIISKVFWMKDSLSEFQKRDVKNLLNCEHDKDYLNIWIEKMGLTKIFMDIVNG